MSLKLFLGKSIFLGNQWCCRSCLSGRVNFIPEVLWSLSYKNAVSKNEYSIWTTLLSLLSVGSWPVALIFSLSQGINKFKFPERAIFITSKIEQCMGFNSISNFNLSKLPLWLSVKACKNKNILDKNNTPSFEHCGVSQYIFGTSSEAPSSTIRNRLM